MNKYLIAVVMVVLAGVGYSQKGEAAACAIAPFTTYFTTGFTCDIGDKTFTNFTLVGSTTGALTGATVTPVPGPPDWGFVFFTPNFVSTSTTASDIAFGYTITCNGAGGRPTDCINSGDLTISGGAVGTGTGTIGENICLNGLTPLAACAVGNSRALNVALSGPLSAHVAFAPVHMLSLLKDANVIGGANGTASISIIRETVDQVVIPEPATLALMGAGLASLAALRRRKASR